MFVCVCVCVRERETPDENGIKILKKLSLYVTKREALKHDPHLNLEKISDSDPSA